MCWQAATRAQARCSGRRSGRCLAGKRRGGAVFSVGAVFLGETDGCWGLGMGNWRDRHLVFVLSGRGEDGVGSRQATAAVVLPLSLSHGWLFLWWWWWWLLLQQQFVSVAPGRDVFVSAACLPILGACGRQVEGTTGECSGVPQRGERANRGRAFRWWEARISTGTGWEPHVDASSSGPRTADPRGSTASDAHDRVRRLSIWHWQPILHWQDGRPSRVHTMVQGEGGGVCLRVRARVLVLALGSEGQAWSGVGKTWPSPVAESGLAGRPASPQQWQWQQLCPRHAAAVSAARLGQCARPWPTSSSPLQPRRAQAPPPQAPC